MFEASSLLIIENTLTTRYNDINCVVLWAWKFAIRFTKLEVTVIHFGNVTQGQSSGAHFCGQSTLGFHQVKRFLSFALVNFGVLRSRSFGFLLIRPSVPGFPRKHLMLMMDKIPVLDKYWCRFSNRIEATSIRRNTKHERQCFSTFSNKYREENWIGGIENTIQSEVFLMNSCYGERHLEC